MEEEEICLVCGYACRSFTGSADLLAVLSHRNHPQYQMYLPIATRIVEIHLNSTVTNETDVLKHLSNFPSPFLCANCCYYVTDFMNAESMVADAKTVLEKRMQDTFESFSRAPKRAVHSDDVADGAPPSKRPCPTPYKTRKSRPPIPLFSEPGPAPAVPETPPNEQRNAAEADAERVERPERRKRRKGVHTLACQVPSCRKVFKNTSNFFIHIAKFHRKDVVRVCPLCSHLANSKKDLQRHLYLKHPAKRHIEWFCCHNCPAIFQDKTLLCRHLQLFQHQAAPKRLSLAKLLANVSRRQQAPPSEDQSHRKDPETVPEDADPAVLVENQEMNQDSNALSGNTELTSNIAPEINPNLSANERDLPLVKLQPVVKVQRLAMESLIATPEGGYVFNQAPPLPLRPVTPTDSSVSTITDAANLHASTSLVNELEEDDVLNQEDDDEEAELAALVTEVEPESASPQGSVFKCKVDDCDGVFSTVNFLNVHLIKLHKRAVRHMCPYCAQIFDTAQEMDDHILASHTTDNPYRYKCNDCAGVFRQKNKLLAHTQRLGHQEAPDGVDSVSDTCVNANEREGRVLVDDSALNGEILQPFVADGLETPSANQAATSSVANNALGKPSVNREETNNGEVDMSDSTKNRNELKARLINLIENRSSALSAREDGDPLAVPSTNGVVNQVMVPNETEKNGTSENGYFSETVPEIEGLALAVSEMEKSVPSNVQLMQPLFVLKPVTLERAEDSTLNSCYAEIPAGPFVNVEGERPIHPTPCSDEFQNNEATVYYVNGFADNLLSSNVPETRLREGEPPVASSTASLPPPSRPVPVSRRRSGVRRTSEELCSSRTNGHSSSRATTPSLSDYDSDESYATFVGERRKRKQPTTVFPCPCCEQTRSHFNALNTHFLDKHNEIIHMCRHCMTIFNTREEYDDHMRQCHPETLKTGFKCLSCPAHYSSKTDLIKHLVRYRHESADHVPPLQ